jgi:hypothetical protein
MHVYIHLLAFLMSVDDLKLKVKKSSIGFYFLLEADPAGISVAAC